MSGRKTPPFRADHVGSLLRPANLLDARKKAKAGEIDAAALKAVENDAINDAVALQESLGLQVVTDGEFRRDFWHLDFLAGFDGMEWWETALGAGFNNDEQPPLVKATGKVGHSKGIFTDHFAYLKSVAKATPKITIPGPAMMHMRPGREGIDAAVYPDLAEFWDDLCAAYRAEIAELGEEGCTYLQVDDVSFAYLCDDGMCTMMRNRGDDPADMLDLYTGAMNDALRDRPEGMTATVHMCRGNFKSSWVAEGGYEPVADKIFNSVDADGFFMEFDTDRAGGFEPLRFLPAGKIVVLGLVTTKQPDLETKDELKRRVDEATKYVALDQLCLSPQCGFSSTHHGNDVTVDDQKRKLALVVETAADIWG
jgi:5-methyltetrahydropteroyltriglutamate--homocysteine methyltransferase